MKKIIKDIIPYIVIVLLVVIIRSFIITPVVVVGSSMEETLKEDELLLLSKISYRFNDIERYDIVVVNNDIHDKLIKRVIGLPGDNIEFRNNKLFINNKFVEEDYVSGITDDFSLKGDLGYKKIPEGYYFVLGDNRVVSIDSRSKEIGLISKNDIMGKVVLRFWPINKIDLVK